MNLIEIRQKYPQYNNLSDEELARGLHKKYYPQLDFEDFAQRIGYMSTNEEPVSIPEMTPEMRAQADAMAQDMARGNYKSVVGNGLSGFGEGVVSGLGRVASGATLGLTDLIDRKTGGNLTALDERLQQRADAVPYAGTANKIAKFGTEIAGNIGGAGGAITKGLMKTGVKGLGLTAADSALQGGIYGATGSDKIEDLPVNVAAGAVEGVAFGSALHGAAKTLAMAGGALRNNTKKGMDYLRSKFGDDYVNGMIKEAEEKGMSLAEVADQRALDTIQMARQQTPDARYTITDNVQKIEDARGDRANAFIDDMFGNKSGFETVEDVANEAKKKAEPLFKDLEAYQDLDPVFNGKNNLIDQLNSGKYADIPFGALPENVKQQVNQIRINNGEIPIDANMIIPANVVRKWGGNRLNENYSPERVAQIADEVFHSSNVKVSEGNFPHIQKLIKERPEHTNDFYGFVSRDKNTGQTTAKTIYEKGRSSAGRQPASLQNENSAGRMRLSDLQTSSLPNNIPSLGEFVNSNNVVNNAIKSVKGAYSSLKGLPDTDARVVLEARKLLSKQTISPDPTMAFQAKQALKEFDDALPAEFRTKLEEANKIYRGAYQFREAADLGRDVFSNASSKSPERFASEFRKLTGDEKEALRLGLRDELKNIINGKENPVLGWKRVITENAQQKIKTVLGAKEGEKLIAKANAEIKAMRNTNNILGGSQTSEKQGLRDKVGFVRNVIKPRIDTLTGMLPYANARNKGIAELMTNPRVNLARSVFEQTTNPQSQLEALYQALYKPSGNVAAINSALAAYLSGQSLR